MSDGNCSFCGKPHDEVFRLISSNGAKICSECVGRCANMIADEFRKVADDLVSRDLTFPKRDDDGAAA